MNRKIPLKRHLDSGQDMKGLVREIIQRIFPDLEKKMVLFGKDKVYMKNDIGHRLDRML